MIYTETKSHLTGFPKELVSWSFDHFVLFPITIQSGGILNYMNIRTLSTTGYLDDILELRRKYKPL
jgi:hypothetical protein